MPSGSQRQGKIPLPALNGKVVKEDLRSPRWKCRVNHILNRATGGLTDTCSPAWKRKPNRPESVAGCFSDSPEFPVTGTQGIRNWRCALLAGATLLFPSPLRESENAPHWTIGSPCRLKGIERLPVGASAGSAESTALRRKIRPGIARPCREKGVKLCQLTRRF